MAEDGFDQETAGSTRLGRLLPLVVISLFLLMAGGLWARYGNAVFAEMVAAAWALCF